MFRRISYFVGIKNSDVGGVFVLPVAVGVCLRFGRFAGGGSLLTAGSLAATGFHTFFALL